MHNTSLSDWITGEIHLGDTDNVYLVLTDTYQSATNLMFDLYTELDRDDLQPHRDGVWNCDLSFVNTNQRILFRGLTYIARQIDPNKFTHAEIPATLSVIPHGIRLDQLKPTVARVFCIGLSSTHVENVKKIFSDVVVIQ